MKGLEGLSVKAAFKVGDEIIERAKPFKRYVIKDLLLLDNGEHTYRITDQGLNQEVLRDVRESQIIALREIFGKLLNIAKIQENDATKHELMIAIGTARNTAQAQSIPADTLDDFLREIEAVTKRLETLKHAHGSSIGFQSHMHGDGVVAVLTQHSPLNPEAVSIAAKLPAFLTPAPLPPLQLDGLDQQQQQLLQAWHRDASRRAPIEHCCRIDMQKLLHLWSADINHRRLGPGEKDKNKKADILPIAKHYFDEHEEFFYGRSASGSGSQKLFYNFAEEFYKCVTGEDFFAPDEIKGLSGERLQAKLKDTIKSCSSETN